MRDFCRSQAVDSTAGTGAHVRLAPDGGRHGGMVSTVRRLSAKIVPRYSL